MRFSRVHLSDLIQIGRENDNGGISVRYWGTFVGSCNDPCHVDREVRFEGRRTMEDKLKCVECVDCGVEGWEVMPSAGDGKLRCETCDVLYEKRGPIMNLNRRENDNGRDRSQK